MKDKRAIIIRSPQLIKVRNALREIIFQALSLEKKRLYNKWRRFLVDDNGFQRTIDDFSATELDQFRQIQKDRSILSDLVDRSILKCIACGKGSRNMVYNKPYNAWYCTVCFGLEKDYAERLYKERKKNLKNRFSHREEIIENHYKTFL